MQYMLHHIHWAALKGAVLLSDAAAYRKIAFGITGGDSQDAGHPAPEYGSGAANCNCCRDADDITGSDRGGKCCRQGREWRDISFPGFFSTTVHAAAGTRFFSGSCLAGAKKAETDPQRDLSLDKARTDRKVNMGSHQKDEHGESPQKFL